MNLRLCKQTILLLKCSFINFSPHFWKQLLLWFWAHSNFCIPLIPSASVIKILCGTCGLFPVDTFRDAHCALWFTMQTIAIHGSNNATPAHVESFQISSSDLLISFIYLLKHFLHQYRIVDAIASSLAHYLKSVMFIKRLGLFPQST